MLTVSTYLRRMPSPRTRRPPRPYHHGDLRQALLAAAVRLLRAGGTDALTLRAVAREAGVSQTAPYRHFADREALVAGVAEAGFRELHAAIVAAVDGAVDKGRGLQRIALAYVRFALEHPAEYRIMFGHQVVARRRDEGLREAGGSVFALLSGGIAHLQSTGRVRAGDPDTMAVSAWALVHGLVTLVLDDQLPPGTARDLETLATEATGFLMFGMAAGAPPPAVARAKPGMR